MKKRIVKIERAPFYPREFLFPKSKIEFQEGLTVLVGCNGSGKTTLIRCIKDFLSINHIKYISYNNLSDGVNEAREIALNNQDFDYLVSSINSSEGQNIMMSLSRFFCNKKYFGDIDGDTKELWILCDAVDSGLSIDNILKLKNFFDYILNNKPEDVAVYIVVSTNEYELADGNPCMDVQRGIYTTFKSYKRFRSFIIRSKKKLDARKDKWVKQ